MERRRTVRTYLRLIRALLRILSQKRCLDYDVIRHATRGKCGLEIGGPSLAFRSRLGTIPVYGIAARVDICDYAERTVWTSRWCAGLTQPKNPTGLRLVSEGSQLALKSEAYAFVLTSHVLEHCANPLKAVMEWQRVLQPGGLMVLRLPHRAATFDHRRPYTDFAHLEEDFQNDVGETDLTHLEEILALHDLARDRAAGTWAQFRERSLRNAESRGLHHHVFSPELLIDMCTWARLTVLSVSVERPEHIIVVAAKRENDALEADNARFLKPEAQWRRRDPFRNKPDAAIADDKGLARTGL